MIGEPAGSRPDVDQATFIHGRNDAVAGNLNGPGAAKSPFIGQWA